MAVGVKHYKKDGTLFTGASHKMADGTLHTGKSHTKSSEKLFHMKDLPKAVRNKLMKQMKNKGGKA
tara:strand:- start:271 stop:468 length:198 start_codon:yes stop_codon:yes gene_type:complete